MGLAGLPETMFFYFHGFASGPFSNKASAFKKRFQQLGIPLQIPDLENGNFKNLTLSSQMEIVERTFQNFPAKQYGLIGSSMGGLLAAMTAELKPAVTSAYLMCPGFYFVKRWEKRLLEENPGWDEIPDLIRIFNYRYNKEMEFSKGIFLDARKWEQSVLFERDVPLRIVHGVNDDIVDVKQSREFVRNRPWATLQELDSDHGLLSHLDWIINDCLEFFQQQGLVT